MATLADIEKHLLDDAKDLMATIGMTHPLMGIVSEYLPDEQNRKAYLYLRGTLAKTVVLILCRLFDRSLGRTGITASIQTYLELARDEGFLSQAAFVDLECRRQDIIEKLERDGIPYGDLKKFRDAELAHSVHAHVPLTNRLPSLPIWDCASNTYNLVCAITRQAGRPSPELESALQDWLDIGRAFWKLS